MRGTAAQASPVAEPVHSLHQSEILRSRVSRSAVRRRMRSQWDQISDLIQGGSLDLSQGEKTTQFPAPGGEGAGAQLAKFSSHIMVTLRYARQRPRGSR
jgi:hypothetical protein